MKTLISIVLLLPLLGNGQSKIDESSIKAELIRLTKDYFDAYNNCDVEKIMSFNDKDIEVYTDKAGTTLGYEAVKQQYKNFCSYTSAQDKPTVKIEILGDLNVHILLTKDDKVYGALVQGKLADFLINKQTRAKDGFGTNEFFFLLKYDNSKWLILRDVSYNGQRTKKD